jgi:hypothetical protein
MRRTSLSGAAAVALALSCTGGRQLSCQPDRRAPDAGAANSEARAANAPPGAGFIAEPLAAQGIELRWYGEPSARLGVSEPVATRRAFAVWTKLPRRTDAAWSAVLGPVPEPEPFSGAELAALAKNVEPREAPSREAALAWLEERDRKLNRASLSEYKRGLDAVPFAAAADVEGARQPEFLGRESVLLWVLNVPAPQAAVALGFGSWSDPADAGEMPSAAEHLVVHAHWALEHGAVPIFVGGDSVEMWVDEAPREASRLRALAWQHCLYSPELCEPIPENFVELPAQMRAHSWYFWWD